MVEVIHFHFSGHVVVMCSSVIQSFPARSSRGPETLINA